MSKYFVAAPFEPSLADFDTVAEAEAWIAEGLSSGFLFGDDYKVYTY